MARAAAHPPARPPDLLAPDAPVGDWGRVCGELLAFNDPESRLPAVDRLEGFNPGGTSLYTRVLVPVFVVNKTISLAWIYVGNQLNLSPLVCRLRRGIWPD